MRWVLIMVVCWLAGFAALSSAFSQNTDEAKKSGKPVFAKVGAGTAQDYQKDNPLLKTDLNQVSKFQGKMFETKEVKNKEFGLGIKDQPIVMNQTFTQASVLQTDKNGWQNKEGEALKKSDLTSQKSTFADKKARVDGDDVVLKMVAGFDGRMEDAKKAPGFGQMLSEGQKRYLGPESPENVSEMELIQDRLKQAKSPEDLKKNQLSADEVQKLLQPSQPMTRPK